MFFRDCRKVRVAVVVILQMGKKNTGHKGFGWLLRLVQFWTQPPHTMSPGKGWQGQVRFLHFGKPVLRKWNIYCLLHLYWWSKQNKIYTDGGHSPTWYCPPPAFPDKVYPWICLKKESTNKQQGLLTPVSCQIRCNQQTNHFHEPTESRMRYHWHVLSSPCHSEAKLFHAFWY